MGNKEDISIARDDLRDNPGKHYIGKLLANSSWGKFDERNDRQHTEFINKPSAFFPSFLDKTKIIKHTYPVSEDIVEVTWKHTQESV